MLLGVPVGFEPIAVGPADRRCSLHPRNSADRDVTSRRFVTAQDDSQRTKLHHGTPLLDLLGHDRQRSGEPYREGLLSARAELGCVHRSVIVMGTPSGIGDTVVSG